MSLFTPVEDLNKMKAKQEAESMFIDMLGEMLLNSAIPEDRKTGLRVLVSMKRAKDNLAKKVERLCNPEQDHTEELYAKQKEALELLEKINAMIDGFDETVTPVNKDTNEIKE